MNQLKKASFYNNLFILPFDHYSAFTELVVAPGAVVEEKDIPKIAELKMLIYQGFLRSWQLGVPQTSSAIIVDELFGQPILQAAQRDGVAVCLGVEEHNTKEFGFVYGAAWPEKINQLKPAIVKALIKYNPSDDLELNKRQALKLKLLSDFCQTNGYIFMLEPLVPPTEFQLREVKGDKERYDEDVRPLLAVKMLAELYQAGVKPDIWKLEGCSRLDYCQNILQTARRLGGQNVNIIMLGRNQPLLKVENQLKAAAQAGWFGFAVGRTVFQEPLQQYVKDNNSAAAIQVIAANFYHLYKFFKDQSVS
ncbi:DUF2090 domain-containing protein [Patescibacteria group bacterium]|nr:DUF2090 domain-containing protein [Patescibacteria group bacterium]